MTCRCRLKTPEALRFDYSLFTQIDRLLSPEPRSTLRIIHGIGRVLYDNPSQPWHAISRTVSREPRAAAIVSSDDVAFGDARLPVFYLAAYTPSM
jgi:hypothetical protein